MSKCGRCGRPIRPDASTCPPCLAAAKPDPRAARGDDAEYWIAMFATTSAILIYLFVIRW